jgi:hypothetical protein
MLVVGTGKAVGLREAGGLGEAGGPTRQVGQQGRWANKAGG